MKPVYLEYLILDNLIMNFVLLWTTGKIIKITTGKWRMGLGATIGTLYAVLFFLPEFYILNYFSLKFILSIIMILITFRFRDIKGFLKALGVFYGVTFIFGGAAFGIFYLFSDQVFIENGIFYIHSFPFHILVVSSAVSAAIIRYTWIWVKNRLTQEQVQVEVEIVFDNLSRRVKALLDTGNALCDPISKTPVVVVEFKKIKDILPTEIQNIFVHHLEQNLDAMMEVLAQSSWIVRFRMIPFTSLGKENGLLLGFKPTKVCIHYRSEWREIKNVIVGIYAHRLSRSDDYDALLHPDLIEEFH